MRSDNRSGSGAYSGTAEGVPMTLELTIRDCVTSGYTVRLPVGLDTATTPTGGGNSGDAGPPASRVAGRRADSRHCLLGCAGPASAAGRRRPPGW